MSWWNNNNSLETLTLNSLIDDVYNDITTAAGASCTGNCIVSTTCGKTPGPGVLPFTIVADGNYACSFVGRTNVCNDTVIDEVTGGTVDEDGVPFSPTDTATVVISVTRPTP